MFKNLMMTAAVSAFVATGALAQTATENAPATDMNETVATDPKVIDTPVEPEFTSIDQMTVEQVIGFEVIDGNGEDVGEIDYVLEGPEAVIGIGGFLGLGEYTVALPLEDFELNEDYTAFVLDRTKEELEAIPEFDESGAESLPGETLISTLMSDTDNAAASSTDMDVNADTEGDVASDSIMQDDADTAATGTMEEDADAPADNAAAAPAATDSMTNSDNASNEDAMEEDGGEETTALGDEYDADDGDENSDG
ncbi:hypothetical protein KDD17_14765 [Sulfitobacter albidus]|uniref:PRC-barrel domain containing protein n=1 Tax=Sulfitobacter albidus TaxID=2829501 RepID=A0A975JCV8_9RHOB|nr:hypothetical protein [Sulfitobacter albidus]QUJ76154.1 hypothetical protein KDD17_14765 [Sulfitobacter albidus]